MKKKYKYNAFISYRHVSPDKEIADKLQKKLENYKPPKSLSEGKRFGGWRVFRDETELPTSSNLSNDIKSALEESEYLIVICSKTTSESRWCMEEIEYFKQLHNGNNSNIITLVADGNPEDIFPPALCNELIPVTDENGKTTYQNHVIEPLAANVSGKNLKETLKKLNTEFLRIAAPILGCGYDNLYNREHKKKIRRIFTFGSIVFSLLLLFAIYNSAMLLHINNQRIALAEANEDLQNKTIELNLSNENLKKSNAELAQKTKEAEENLIEANKQKKASEENLKEAERQRNLAEKNLAEANRQKQIAEENLAEANRQKQIAEENLAEANRQKQIAEENAQEANTQRGIAEENMKVAQENEAKANEQTRLAQIENAKSLTFLAQNFWEQGDAVSAIENSASALQTMSELTYASDSGNKLAQYVGAFKQQSFIPTIKLNHKFPLEQIGYSGEGTLLVTRDKSGVYLWNAETGELKEKINNEDEYSSQKVYFEDNGIVEKTYIYDRNLNGIAMDDRGMLQYSKEFKDEESLCGHDFFVTTHDDCTRFDGKTGEIIWTSKVRDTSTSNYDITKDYVVESVLSYDNTKSSIFLLNKNDGSIVAEYKLDTDYNFKSGGNWLNFTGGKAFWAENYLFGNKKIMVFDINDGYITNPKILLETNYDLFSQLLSYEETEEDILILMSGTDTAYMIYDIVLSVFDKETQSLKFQYTFEQSSVEFSKLGYLKHENLNSFCDIVFAVFGKKLVLLNNDNGEILHEYELSDYAVNAYYSEFGIIHIITADGNEIAIGLRNIDSSEHFKSTSFVGKLVLREFMLNPALCAYYNNAYAAAEYNSTDVYLYRAIENEDFTRISQTASASEVVVNEQGTYAIIEEYGGIQQEDYAYKVIIADLLDNSDYDLVEYKSGTLLTKIGFINDKIIFVSTNDVTEIYDIELKNKVATYNFSINEFMDIQRIGGKIFASPDYKTIVEFDETGWNSYSLKEGTFKKFSVSGNNKIAIAAYEYANGSYWYEVFIYNISNNTNIKVEFSSTQIEIADVEWLSDDVFAICLKNGEIYTFDGETGKCIYNIKTNAERASELIPIATRNCYAIVCEDSKIYTIDTQTGKVIDELKTAYTDYETKNLYWEFVDNNILLVLNQSTCKGYFIDTTNFTVKYFIEDFVDYNIKNNAIYTQEYGVFGFYPFYESEELINKARSYIHN